MKRLTLLFILTGVIAAPSIAEVYGEVIPDAPEATGRIKTVPRAIPSGASIAAPATEISTKHAKPDDELRRPWHLKSGRLVRQELSSWGEQAGWQVLWHLQRDWTVPADTEFDGDFKDAASAVIRTLADNGLVIRGQFYDGNRILVVSGAGPVVPDPQ